MSMHLLCDEPTTPRCPPSFRVRASSWIDHSNIGDTTIPTPPPAGIRMRWNWPFLSLPPAERIGKPVSYFMERGGPLNHASLWLPSPTVGHSPRAPTPRPLWQPLMRVDALTFSFGRGPCQGGEAVYFEVPSLAQRGTVTLIDTNGIAQIIADVGPGDRFHFELGDLKTVTFSANLLVSDVLGLHLAGDEAGDYHFQQIAEIIAENWHTLNLATVSERIANAAGEPFGTLSEQDWMHHCNAGHEVSDAFDANVAVPEMAGNALLFAGGNRFETSTLMGWGFVDGEHPRSPVLDHINASDMLAHPDGEVYVYRVRALLQTPDRGLVEQWSVPSFAIASLAQPLADAHCRVVPNPISQIDITNFINPGPDPSSPEKVASPRERIYCVASWEIAYSPPTTESVVTHPVAQDSLITGTQFEDPGEFLAGSNRLPRTVRRLEVIEFREHRFDVPFFDSDVGLELESRDGWDRRVKCPPASMVQPIIDYQGKSIPIATAACNAYNGTKPAEVTVTLDSQLNWKADELAAASGAKIILLMRDPALTVAEAVIEIGPATASADGYWAAEVQSSLAQAELDRFVGGTLAVAGFTARIRGFGPVNAGRARCTFEAVTTCAGALLYACPNVTTPAKLYENPESDRLWKPLGQEIAVLSNGLPAQYSATARLPDLSCSATLYFANRLEFVFEWTRYLSALSLPISAPYIHPAPLAPDTCFSIQQLGSDYYGRALVRVAADKCPRLDQRYAARLSFAPGGDLDDQQFSSARSGGVFGAQSPFECTNVFDAFSTLGSQTEGTLCTMGLSFVREADNREGTPKLEIFTARRID